MIRGPRSFTFEPLETDISQSSEDFDIIVNAVHRPILPALRPRKLTIPGKHGAWDFGNNTREEVIIPIDCTLVDPLDKVLTTEDIAAWLNQKGKLIISDTPKKYYIGRVYAEILPKIDGRIGTFTLPFVCDPFAYSVSETTDEILLGDGIPLGSDVTLGNANNYTFVLVAPVDLSIDNFGKQSIRPTVIIYGSFDTITITMNGKSLTYGSTIVAQELILDGEHYTAELDDVNILAEFTGDTDDFLTLQPGNNTVTITGTNLDCTVQFEFRPIYY